MGSRTTLSLLELLLALLVNLAVSILLIPIQALDKLLNSGYGVGPRVMGAWAFPPLFSHGVVSATWRIRSRAPTAQADRLKRGQLTSKERDVRENNVPWGREAGEKESSTRQST